MSQFLKRKAPDLLKPPALKPGACIGIATPGFPGPVVLKNKFERGVAFLESLGFRVKLGNLTAAFASQGYRTGTAIDRANEFNTLYKDPEVSALLFSIGGSNSSSLLPYLDYDYIRAFPKIVSGYSDSTSIHTALNAQCGLCTFYGPALIPSFGTHPHPDAFTVDNFLLQTGFNGAFDTYTFPCPERYSDHFIDARAADWTAIDRIFKTNSGWEVLRSGTATGPIYSYNLNTLVSLAGTPYFPMLDGALLCLEQMSMSMAQEERQLTQLAQLGVLDAISGLLISKPETIADTNSTITYSELLLEVIPASTTFPIVLNFDCGHTHPMLTIAQGVACVLTANDAVCLVQQECGFC